MANTTSSTYAVTLSPQASRAYKRLAGSERAQMNMVLNKLKSFDLNDVLEMTILYKRTNYIAYRLRATIGFVFLFVFEEKEEILITDIKTFKGEAGHRNHSADKK
jgi:hypothetical protein